MNLWSTKARQGHRLHRICPYQGSFPPQLPAYFLGLVPDAKTVLDPFTGRGTVILEAVLHGKTVYGVDVNPVALALSRVKLNCASKVDIINEIEGLDLSGSAPSPPDDVEPFFHPETWEQVYNLRGIERSPTLTALILGRLHGHSPGFFSTTTFNVISVNAASLRRARKKHGTRPEPRDVKKILLSAASRFIPDIGVQGEGEILKGDARNLPFPDNSVDFVVTSPPFLDVIDYADVNWLRLWFLGAESPLTFIRKTRDYTNFICACLRELARVAKPTAHIVFEVGPVKRDLKLSDLIVHAAAGILHVEQTVTQSFEGDGVPKISRAMKKGQKTTTMENNCVVMRPFEGTVDLEIKVPEEEPSILDLF